MNWKMWRRFWVISLGRYLWVVRTPWFAILLASGAHEPTWCAYWYGIRFQWGHPKGWNLNEGEMAFYKCDSFLSWTVSERQIYGR